MTWNPTNTPEHFFDCESRAAIEELCKRALELIRSGTGIDSPELALLLNAIWALANALAQRMLRGQSVNWQLDAVDVADSFVDLLRGDGLPRFDLERPFLPYAWRIVERLCSEKQRYDRVRYFVPLPESLAGTYTTPPEALIRQYEARSNVRRAVRRLPRNLRRAVIARYWMGLCPRMAAARLGANVDTFNGWTFRARIMLRAALNDEFGFVD